MQNGHRGVSLGIFLWAPSSARARFRTRAKRHAATAQSIPQSGHLVNADVGYVQLGKKN
jgi:hypothetical protein